MPSAHVKALTSYTPEWNDRLAYDVALALEGGLPSLDPVVARHGVDPVEFVTLLDNPVFLKAILALREEISVKGVVFQTRARSLAEDVLMTTHKLSRDPDVSPAVRHDCAKSVVRWAGYDKPDTSDALGADSGVTISINIGGDHRSLSLGTITPDDTRQAPRTGLTPPQFEDDDKPRRLLPKMPDPA